MCTTLDLSLAKSTVLGTSTLTWAGPCGVPSFPLRDRTVFWTISSLELTCTCGSEAGMQKVDGSTGKIGIMAKKSLKNRVDRIYRLCGRAILGTLRTTSTVATNALACIKNPEIDIQEKLIMMKPKLDIVSRQHSKQLTPQRHLVHVSPKRRLEKAWKEFSNWSKLEEWQQQIIKSRIESRSDIKTIKTCIGDFVNSQEKEMWKTEKNGNKLRDTSFCPVEWRKNQWFSKLSKSQVSDIACFLTGHVQSRVYLRRFGLSNCPVYCRLCKDPHQPETRDHLLGCRGLPEILPSKLLPVRSLESLLKEDNWVKLANVIRTIRHFWFSCPPEFPERRSTGVSYSRLSSLAL